MKSLFGTMLIYKSYTVFFIIKQKAAKKKKIKVIQSSVFSEESKSFSKKCLRTNNLNNLARGF